MIVTVPVTGLRISQAVFTAASLAPAPISRTARSASSDSYRLDVRTQDLRTNLVADGRD